MTEPAPRASDADRERAAEVLRRAGGDGRLDFEELDQRLAAAFASRTLPELHRLTADLAGTTPTPTGSGTLVRPGPGGTRRVLSLMGGQERRGRWRVARTCTAVCVMGGADLDLTAAELSDAETTIRVFTIMGGAELRLPRGVDVQVSRLALMGGHDVQLDPEPPPPGAPVVRLQLWSLMGGAKVRQGPRRARRGRLDQGEAGTGR